MHRHDNSIEIRGAYFVGGDSFDMDHGYLSKTVPPDKFCRGDSFCQNSTRPVHRRPIDVMLDTGSNLQSSINKDYGDEIGISLPGDE